MILAQAVVSFVPCIAARKRHDSHDFGMTDEVEIEIGWLRQRELEHDLLIRGQCTELLHNARFEQGLGLGFFRAANINLRLNDWSQAGLQDLPRELELLAHYFLNAGWDCL